MGSLTSRPKTPSTAATAAQTVYVPVAATTDATTATPVATSTSTSTSTDTTTAATDTGTVSSTPETQRQAGLLERSRGALSTVLTSFRGILDNSVKPSARKTLLGE